MTFPYSRKRNQIADVDADYEFNNIIQNLNNSHNINFVVNVLDFGATGDGVTDDSNAITAALNYLLATSTRGGTLYFPSGQYKFSLSLGGGTDYVTIAGDGLGTKFFPKDATSFVLNYTQGVTAYHHFVRDFQIVSTSNHVGRGIYVNNGGFMVVDRVRFDSLEYGYYSNASEWCHFQDCFFTSNSTGAFCTNLTSDILGNAPTLSQNAAEQYFIQCMFWTNTLGFYGDNKNYGGTDQVSSDYFIECDFLNNVAALALGDGGYNYFPSLYLNCVWFENNTSTGTQSANGYTIYNGDISVNNGTVNINNTLFTSRVSLKGVCRAVGNDVKFTGSTSLNFDSGCVINFDNLVADANGGSCFDLVEGRNPQPYTSERPVLTRIPTRTAFTLGNFYNKINLGTSTCAFGSAPSTAAGSPTKTFVTGDGFYANTCLKVNGSNGDGVQWNVGVTSGKYYVTTVAMRSDSGNIGITIGSGGSVIWPSGTLNLTAKWRTYGCLALCGTTTTSTVQFYLTGTQTIYFSCIQSVEFDNLNDAVNFFDSNTYSVLLAEAQANIVSSTQSTATNFPTSGQYGDLVNISLTPGTWLVSGTLRALLNGSTTTSCELGISSTSGNSATGLTAGDNDLVFLPPTATSNSSCSIPSFKVAPATTTTYYLKYLANYSAGTPQAKGRISAVQSFM